MKFTLFASLIATAAAFAPAPAAVQTSTSLSAAAFGRKTVKPKGNGLPKFWNDQVGVTEPAGFFDPLKLSEGGEGKSNEQKIHSESKAQQSPVNNPQRL